MSLTYDSTGIRLLRKKFALDNPAEPIIALTGNPNTGKSTVFNQLTGLNQHTGNWPGKTVSRARGHYLYQNKKYTVIDLPGTYSLSVTSVEERINRDFICFARPEVTVIMADATCLERNLNLTLQILELTNNALLCLNFMDDAERKNINIDIRGLSEDLQIPVIPAVAREGRGLLQLKEKIARLIAGEIKIRPVTVNYSSEIQKAVNHIIPEIKAKYGPLCTYINCHWLALRLLEGDKTILDSIYTYLNHILVSNSGQKHRRRMVADEIF
ncbi:MAG: FeoB small GTPase domain-containing protein [Halanaerobiaceae bacterium]